MEANDLLHGNESVLTCPVLGVAKAMKLKSVPNMEVAVSNWAVSKRSAQCGVQILASRYGRSIAADTALP